MTMNMKMRAFGERIVRARVCVRRRAQIGAISRGAGPARAATCPPSKLALGRIKPGCVSVFLVLRGIREILVIRSLVSYIFKFSSTLQLYACIATDDYYK